MMFTPDVKITLREQTSERMVEDAGTIDMVFTSPPYWDIEYYGSEPDQLGYNRSYTDFLHGIRRILRESYRVLRDGRFCIFNINDFRKDGKLYSYHTDIINIFQESGFSLHDIIIVKWQSAIGACFASQIEERKITAKSHEYLVVGRK